ncbi:MAG: hypothetical protein QOG43_3444 [Actinomycetota bacterium]|nr:hypothetical protein [Actinomycetota bacterium]
MRVRLLGSFEVEGVPERNLGSRKGRTVLKVLALAEGAPVSVDRLADALWGDDQPARPADQVSVLVSRLRGVIGAERISRTATGYAFGPDWLDVRELRNLTEASARALAEGRVGAARAAAGAALALTRGGLLADEDGEWVEAERAAVDATVTRVTRLAVDAAVAAGDHGAAASLAEQALARDPYDEVALRALMGAHLTAGRPASALAAYARFRARVAEELGVPPTSETEALHLRALAAADGDGDRANDGDGDRDRDGEGSPDAGAGPPPTGTARAGMVGRDGEVAVLDRGLATVASGSGSGLVVVEGDAGIGKTTLVDAWCARVGRRAFVLRGRCDELGRDLPLQPVTDALADHLRMIGPEAAAAVLGDDGPALAPLLGPVTGAGATVVADAESSRVRLFAALVNVLGRIGETRPAVLVIEDLHVGGTGMLAWLAFARRRASRTFVVVTTRPGGADALDATARITLGPLGPDAVAELVGPDRAGPLWERSGGHPLLLAALAAAADDPAADDPAGDGGQLPSTLRDAVAARVDSVGKDVGATLRVAAVLGPDCDLELIAQVAATPAVDVLDHLEAAARAGLVVERGSRFRFRHQLIREALEAATGAARRALVHQQAARALAARPRPDLLAVAVHARAGGDAALGATWFLAAAAAAAARFDVEAAEHHIAAALALAPTADAYVARARVRMSRVALEAAADDAAQAVAMGGGAPALEAAGWVAYYRRRYGEARAYADEAADRAGDDAVRGSARALAGRIRHAAGDLDGAVEQLVAAEGAPPPVRGVAGVWLGLVRLHQGRPHEALDAMVRAAVDPDSLAHPWAPLHLRFNRVLALGQLGRVADGLRATAELDEAVARQGAVGVRFTAHAANMGAWILRWSGRGDEADDRNRVAVEVTGGDGGPAADAVAEAHYVALLDLADGCQLRGDEAGAARLAQRLLTVDTWEGTMAWHQRHRLGLLRARLALADGDADGAAGLARAVAGDAAARGAGRYQLLARAVAGLADPSIPADELEPTVEGLGVCAALDGWPLVAALAAARRSDRWRAEAERRAAAMVASAASAGADHADDARRFADRILNA